MFLSDSKISLEIFDAVLVCAGHHTIPYVPLMEGHQQFKGSQLHSSEVRKIDEFSDKRVVVAGLGNSAVDMACELSRICNQVRVFC